MSDPIDSRRDADEVPTGSQRDAQAGRPETVGTGPKVPPPANERERRGGRSWLPGFLVTLVVLILVFWLIF